MKNQTNDPDKLLAECQKQANSLIKKQTESFLVDGADFKNVAISNFAAQFGNPVFTEEEERCDYDGDDVLLSLCSARGCHDRYR